MPVQFSNFRTGHASAYAVDDTKPYVVSVDVTIPPDYRIDPEDAFADLRRDWQAQLPPTISNRIDEYEETMSDVQAFDHYNWFNLALRFNQDCPPALAALFFGYAIDAEGLRAFANVYVFLGNGEEMACSHFDSLGLPHVETFVPDALAVM